MNTYRHCVPAHLKGLVDEARPSFSLNLSVCIHTSCDGKSLPCAQHLCTVCAEGLCDWVCLCVYVCIYMYMSQNIGHLASCWSQNVQKSTHAAFLLYLDIVNETINCQFLQVKRTRVFCMCLWAPMVSGDQMFGMLGGVVSQPTM